MLPGLLGTKILDPVNVVVAHDPLHRGAARPHRRRRARRGARPRPAGGDGDGLHAGQAVLRHRAAARGAGDLRRPAGGGGEQRQHRQRRRRSSASPSSGCSSPTASTATSTTRWSSASSRASCSPCSSTPSSSSPTRAADAVAAGDGRPRVIPGIIDWLTDPANWSGPTASPPALFEHLWYSGLALARRRLGRHPGRPRDRAHRPRTLLRGQPRGRGARHTAPGPALRPGAVALPQADRRLRLPRADPHRARRAGDPADHGRRLRRGGGRRPRSPRRRAGHGHDRWPGAAARSRCPARCR